MMSSCFRAVEALAHLQARRHAFKIQGVHQVEQVHTQVLAKSRTQSAAVAAVAWKGGCFRLVGKAVHVGLEAHMAKADLRVMLSRLAQGDSARNEACLWDFLWGD